jgi:DNA-damage-inducible protein J
MMTMATTPTQIRIDSTVKEEATALFSELGMDMSSAVNIFLRQCILRGGLPFPVELPRYNQETLEAMAEARKISRDPDVKGYTNMTDLLASLEADD